jgi:glycosyltransferase involved in cell wall biosynthesis
MKMLSPKKTKILFLNENPLPREFTRATIPGKELRLRASLVHVNEVHVLTFKGTIPINLTDVRKTAIERKIIVHILPSWPHYAKTLPLIVAGWWYSVKLRPSVIEAESPLFSGLAAVILSKLTGIPALIEVRNTFLSMLSLRLKIVPYPIKYWLVKQLQSFVCQQATGLIVNSKKYQQDFKSLNKNTVIINPGIQNLKKYPKKRVPHLRLAYLGRLVEDKGVLLLIEVVKILKSNSNLPLWHLSIAGSGPLTNKLSHLIEEASLSREISLLGAMPASTLLSQTDILINPCLIDSPLEMVNVEAAYCGVPVITFGNHGLPETVLPKITGLVVQEKTATSLAQALTRLMNNPQLRHELSKNGPIFAQKNYDFTDQVKKLNTFYHSLSSK